MEICVTRFNVTTLKENRAFKEANNIAGCIYGTPIKITDKILPNEMIIILEMNNTLNKIAGIGIIKNKLEREDRKQNRIYSDNNYNRFIYKSELFIPTSAFTREETAAIEALEHFLFKTSRHCKRGHGIQQIPKFILNRQDINFGETIRNMYISREKQT